jgi:hypothetical protein
VIADGRQALGYGLLAGAAGVAILLLAWLAVSGVQAGGFVLGLLLLFVLAGPLAGAGWYVLAGGRAEGVQEKAFAGKRRVFDADRLFRAELSSQLRQLAQIGGLPADRLLRIADSVERAAADESAWYEAIQLDDARATVLKQYDDLAWERVRWLRDHAGEPTATLTRAVDELQLALDQRSDLLLRGRQAPAVSPAALLQMPSPAADAAGLVALGVGDALTVDGTDYLVEGLAIGFADGQTWKLAHVVASGGDASERWVSISPGGLELAWLAAVPATEPGARQMVVGQNALDLIQTRSSIVQVVTATGTAPGVLVRSWSYTSGPLRGLVEQWPDGPLRAYAGRRLASAELELWPAGHTQPLASGPS